MKILIVGGWRSDIYEQAFKHSLERSGVEVFEFHTDEFFDGVFKKVNFTFPAISIGLTSLKSNLVKLVKTKRPDYVFFWRPTHILPSAVTAISALGVRTISYNNDDPFGPFKHNRAPWHHKYYWLWYKRCLTHFDFNFFYRQINLVEARQFGARHSALLMPYFLPWKDKPTKLTETEFQKYSADVAFIGHYEKDGRAEKIKLLVDQGLKVKVWGGHYWTEKVLGDAAKRLNKIEEVTGAEYAKAICATKINLCFLSKINRDTYTRRCFEIPACGGLLLAERSNALSAIFDEDVEACFFSDSKELIIKVNWLLENPQKAKKIAESGHKKVWECGHDIYSRTKYFLNELQK